VATVTLLTVGAIPGGRPTPKTTRTAPRPASPSTFSSRRPSATGSRPARAWTGWEARWPLPSARWPSRDARSCARGQSGSSRA